MHNIVTTICEIIICIEMMIDIVQMIFNYPFVLSQKVSKRALTVFEDLPPQKKKEFMKDYQRVRRNLKNNKDIQDKHIIRFKKAKKGLFIDALTNIIILGIWII